MLRKGWMVRSSEANPFTPGFGDARVWVERTPQTSTITSMVGRAVDGSHQAPRIIEQERGYGKTTLLAAIEDHAADWTSRPIVVRVAAVEGEPFTTSFAFRLVESLRAATAGSPIIERVTAALARIRAVRLAGVLGVAFDDTADTDTPPSIALEQALVDLGTTARADGNRPVIVLIDEAQAIDPQSRRSVFTALQAAVNVTDDHGRVLPFVVLLAGLPGVRAAFKRDRVTFGERCRDLPLDRLDDEAIAATLLTFDRFNDAGVRFDLDAIEAMIATVGGHPHLFQLVGEGAWDASPDRPTITAGDVEAGQRSSRRERGRIIGARLSGLTDAQLGWATAAARVDDDQRTLTAVCREYRRDPHATAANCGSLADVLFDKGVIRRSVDGTRVMFALAGMRDHLL